MARSIDVKTPLAIVSYSADLFKLRERDNGGKGYGATLIFHKTTDISVLEKAALDAATEAWGDKAKKLIEGGLVKSPFLDGDGKQGKTSEGDQKKELANSRFIRCTSGADFKPKVFDKQRNPVLELEGCPSGSQVYAVVNAYTWENPTNGKGISFGISLVQVAKKAEGDEVLGGGGGPNADNFFEVIADEGEAPKETQGGAGAGGLFG